MEQIKLEHDNGIALITLNRPEIRNAYSFEMSAELSDAMIECDMNDDVRCVVITGAGDYFSIGLDFNDAGGGIADMEPSRPSGMSRTYPFQIRKPVLCAINGTAGGFGIAYPMACDLRIVAEDATIGFTFVRQGMLPEMGATWLLPRLIGMERAAELLMTGRKLTGAEAVEYGLALRAVPRAEVLDHTLKIARDITDNTAPVATATVKRMLWSRFMGSRRLDQAIVDDRAHFIWAATQADCREGMAAFLEKRPAKWIGKVNQDMPHFLTMSDL
jgi:enoyl-CoA hydratase/carnithine racemase